MPNTASTEASGAVPGVQRGCGTREEGGVYFESGLSEDGHPLEHFLCDPPVPYQVDSTLGQTLIERDGTHHVVDWIGQSGYPYPADIVEEVRRYGLSRRVSKTFDFEKLTPDSCIILVHARAVASDPPEGARFETDNYHGRLDTRCALFVSLGERKHIYNPESAPCTRFWYLDAEETREPRFRENGATTFKVATSEDASFEMESGIIASFPISRICTIESSDGSHEETSNRISEKTEIPNAIQPS